MSTKKISYVKLLKEAIADFDMSKTVDVKGPMLDPILSYKGDGELPTHKDAASILERYYFKEEHDSDIKVPVFEKEGPDNKVGGDKDPIDNDIDEVPDENIEKTKKEIEKAVTEQDKETPPEEKEEEEEEKEEEEVEEEEKGAKPKEDELEIEVKEEDTKIESIENSIIEKLIEEMEEEIIDENAEGEDTEGEGTKAAGAGDAEEEIPDRKDEVDVKGEAAEFSNLEKDILKDVKEGSGLGPIEPDKKDQDSVEEAFKIFKDEIEAEDN